MTGAATGLTMEFTLHRRPQITSSELFTISGTAVKKAIFLGRPETYTLKLRGLHLNSATARQPFCKLSADNGQVLKAAATVISDTEATCVIPAYADTLKPGLSSPAKRLTVTLLLDADGVELNLTSTTPPGFPATSGEGTIFLLRMPSATSLKVAHAGTGEHGTLASLDRKAVQDLVAADATAQLVFSLELSEREAFVQASLHGRTL
jgi:hypothetical protein